MILQETVSKIVYGVAIGDAIGFPYQFIGRQTRKLQPVIDMGISQGLGGKQHKVDESLMGLWSDDASLTLCLAESLSLGYDLQDMSSRFVRWLEDGYLSAQDDAFDVGHQTWKAIAELKNILSKGDLQLLGQRMHRPSVTANGNGALMRILPLVCYLYHKPVAEQYQIVQEVSALTHPHIRSVLCCFLYLRIAERLIDKVGLTEAVRESQKEVKDFIESELSNGLDSQHTRIATPQHHKLIDSEDLEQLYRLLNNNMSQGTADPDAWEQDDYIRSDGYVISSLEAALWCLLNSSNYKETVLKAVNLGDDTDTVAAIAGGLAALHYGYDSIPREWIRSLKKPEIFERIVKLYEEI